LYREPREEHDAAASCAVIVREGDRDHDQETWGDRDVLRRAVEDAALQEAADWGQLV
jgi:hypothetical protein